MSTELSKLVNATENLAAAQERIAEVLFEATTNWNARDTSLAVALTNLAEQQFVAVQVAAKAHLASQFMLIAIADAVGCPDASGLMRECMETAREQTDEALAERRREMN